MTDRPEPARTRADKLAVRTPIGRAWNRFVTEPSSLRRAVRVIIAGYVTAVLLGGLALWLLDPREYSDPFRAFWFVLQTITTVGYGDVTPTEPIGRAIGAVIMLTAIASLSILTAFITSTFVEARQAERRARTDAEETAHRERLEQRLAELVERLERIERQGPTGS